MKKSIFILLSVVAVVLISSCATTQPVSLTELQEGIQKVIEVSGRTKDELFVKANNWAVGAFNNADSVIEFSDKQSGTITGKYIMKFQSTASPLGGWSIGAVTIIKIEVKDEKARISVALSGIDYYNGNGILATGTWGEEMYFQDKEVEIVKERWASLISGFEIALNTSETDW